MGLTVAVTGPTGEVGTSFITALEGAPGVDRILGMARRPFDPAARGWTRTRYRQGDVLDRGAVDALVAEADVVVHLAFLIMGSHAETSRVNRAGARNVTASRHLTAAAGPRCRTPAVPLQLIHPADLAAAGGRGRPRHRHRPAPTTSAAAGRGTQLSDARRGPAAGRPPSRRVLDLTSD